MPKIVKPVMDDPKTLQRRKFMRNMMLGGAALVGASAVGAPAVGAPAPLAGTLPSRTSGLPVWNVLDFGAVGDGIHDNTMAFQTAMDLANKAGGGTVFAPAGHYLFKGNLRIPHSVTLRGIYDGPNFHLAALSTRGTNYGPGEYVTGAGTFLIPTAGQGSETGQPFIDMTNFNTCLMGLSIYYPSQEGHEASPYPFPWTIFMGNYGESGAPNPDYTLDGQSIDGQFALNQTVENVELIFAYNGIACQAPRPLIRNVRGTVFRRGIDINGVWDIGRIENVHWDGGNASLATFQTANLEAFIFGPAAWFYMRDCFVLFANIAYHFLTSESNFLLSKCGADAACVVSVQVETCDSGWGVTWSDSQLFSPFIINPTSGGRMRFTNCVFWSGASISGSVNVMLTSCEFLGTNVDIHAPSRVTFSNCNFGGGQITVDAGVRTAILVACQEVGGINDSSGIVQAGFNTDENAVPLPPRPQPA